MQITQSIQSKIDIDDNTQTLQYYQYLREIIQACEIPYWIGNPSVEIISGKIILQPLKPINSDKQPENYQLYLKEIFNSNYYNQKKQQQQKEEIKNNDEDKETFQQQNKIVSKLDQNSSRCLIICGIPNSKSPVQVMQTQCISRYSHLINEIRVIKTVHIRYYGMLLLMKDHQSSKHFFNQIFAQQYTCLQMQRIIIRQIRAITLSFSQLSIQNGSNQMNLLREINQNSQQIPPESIFMTYHHQKLKETLKIEQKQQRQQQIQQTNHQLQQQQNNKKNYNQLVCAICFQQCNHHQAISILCGHYFDLQCLQKWSQNICPLCRYHQQPPIIKFCQKCNQCQGLWVCLICGSRLCCGVNHDILGQDSHIYDHYKTTNHSLSMELQTKFLFDAKIPAFLHQKFYKDLILSQKQQQQQRNLMQERKSQEGKKKSKITQQIQQYESQVSQQMNKQRLYFQQQINVSIKQHRTILEAKRKQVQTLQSNIQKIDTQQSQTINQLTSIQSQSQTNQKQLQILRNIIRMKQQKVKQKRQQISKNNYMKQLRLKQLDYDIRQKKQQILNYRKNLLLRERFVEKLKGEEVKGEFILTSSNGDDDNSNNKGKGNKKNKGKK